MAIDLGLALVLTVSQLSQSNPCAEIPQRMETVRQQAREAEVQLEEQLASDEFQQQLDRQQRQLEEQLNTLLENEAQLAEVLQNDETPPELIALLNAAQTDPDAIADFLNEQSAQLPAQLRQRIHERRDTLLAELQQLFNEQCR